MNHFWKTSSQEKILQLKVISQSYSSDISVLHILPWFFLLKNVIKYDRKFLVRFNHRTIWTEECIFVTYVTYFVKTNHFWHLFENEQRWYG